MRYALLGGAQLAVGAAAIFARFALTGAGPIAVAASRLTIAAIVLIVIAAVKKPSVSEERPVGGLIFAFAGIALALHFASWIWSLEYTSVAISTLLVATTPIWTALYDAVVRKQRFTTVALFALLAGIAGLVLVVGYGKTQAPIRGYTALGDALAIAGAIAIAAYFILVRHVRGDVGTRAIVTRTYTWAAAVLIVAAACTHEKPPAFTAVQAWGGILAMAFISQLLGHTALNAALRWFSASAVAVTTILEPVIAAVLAFFIFAEGLAPVSIAGAILVLASIAVFLREEALVSAV